MWCGFIILGNGCLMVTFVLLIKIVAQLQRSTQ